MTYTKKQKENIGKIFINIGSITFAGVVLGYFASDSNISEIEFNIGIASVCISYFISIVVDK